MGFLGPPYCGSGAAIRIGREMLCLPYAEFFGYSRVFLGMPIIRLQKIQYTYLVGNHVK